MAAKIEPLQRVRAPERLSTLTSEERYWKSFQSQVLLPSPQSSPVTHISHVSAGASSNAETFAVTSGTRVQIFSTRTRKVVKSINRFNIDDVAHSGNIRRDGRILVAGGDSGAIQAFDIKSRAILKTWREHKQPVWVTEWHPSELTSLMSASDDRTVRIWDLPSDTSVNTFYGHQDYVRSGTFLPGQGQNIMVTGSYDQTVRIWDPRVQGKSVMTFKHAAAVEAVLPLSSGTTVLAAAESQVSILDLVAAKPLNILKNHQKTVTSLCLASNGTRVLSGGLDGHVKVFDTSSWNVVAGVKYSSPILSLDVVPTGASGDDKHLIVGMQSGLLSIRTKLSAQEKTTVREREKEMQALVDGRIEEYDRKKKAQDRKLGKGWEKRFRGKDYTGEAADIVIEGASKTDKRKENSLWQRQLRQGKYEQALDTVLSRNHSSHDIITLLIALRHRSALRAALHNRDEETLQPILRFLNKQLNDPRFIKLITDVTMLVLDMYGPQMGLSREVDTLVKRLHQTVRENAEVSQAALSTQGMLEMLMAGG